MKTLFLAAALVPVLAPAQTGQFSTPTLGRYFDREAKAIRVISGIPGAAGAERTEPLDAKLELAWISPSGNLAIAAVRDAAAAQLVRLGPPASLQALAGALDAEVAAFSPSGTSFVIADANGYQIWSGLPGSPALKQKFPMAGVRCAAVSDDAQIAALIADNSAIIRSSGKELQRLPGAVAVQFLPKSHDLIVAFGDANQLSVLHSPGPDSSIETIATAANGISKPASIAYSSGWIAIANSGAHSVTVIDLRTRTAATVAAPDAVREVSTLRGDPLFLVSARYLSVLDYHKGQWRLTPAPSRGGAR